MATIIKSATACCARPAPLPTKTASDPRNRPAGKRPPLAWRKLTADEKRDNARREAARRRWWLPINTVRSGICPPERAPIAPVKTVRCHGRAPDTQSQAPQAAISYAIKYISIRAISLTIFVPR